jgi:RNA 3'-terminal phosphate cyclase
LRADLVESIRHALNTENLKAKITFVDSPAAECDTNATGILLFAETSKQHRIAASVVFDNTKQAHAKAVEVVQKLSAQLTNGGIVDEYMLDQIVVFMALATGGVEPNRTNQDDMERRQCEILVGKISLHAQTAMRISEIMMGNIIFRTENIEGGVAVVCETRLAS